MNPTTVTIPQGFSNEPQVGKIQQLYSVNDEYLYNKISPYTENSGLFPFGPRQPFISITPNEGRKGINALKRFESRIFPIGSALQDVERLGKFISTGTGVLFLAKQFALQRFNAFNEVRIFNPISPLTGTIRAASAFTLPRLSRHLDPSPSGILSAFTGISVGGSERVSGTIGDVSPDRYKGLVRAKTANSAVERFKIRHSSSSGKNGLFSQLGGPVSAIRGLFNSFGSNKQDAEIHHGEVAYSIMIRDKNLISDFEPRWYNSKLLNKDASETYGRYNFIVNRDDDNNSEIYKKYDIIGSGSFFPRDLNSKSPSKSAYSVNGTYENEIKDGNSIPDTTPLTEKRVLLETDVYIDNISDKLNSLIKNIKEYDITSGSNVDLNYKRLVSHRNESNNFINSDGYESRLKTTNLEYRNNKGSGKGFAGSGKIDYINTLSILTKSENDSQPHDDTLDENGGYDPYKNDQIAFYFHDLVNDKYIPFRATVKGINDTFQAEWGEIKYVGRTDKLFNYTGFSRNIAFSFDIVINSIKELLPTWRRINYLCSMVKPSKYTSGNVKNLENQSFQFTSRFPVPPLVTFTIGDMYKEQPLILQNVGLTIPDDALWETLPENSNVDWHYFNEQIKWKGSKGKFAQFPRECSISIAGPLIEKEIPHMGYNVFGDVGEIRGNKFSDKMIGLSSGESKYYSLKY